MPAKRATKKVVRSPRSKSDIAENNVELSSESQNKQTISKVANSNLRKYLIVGLVVIILAGLLYLNRGLFVVGMVNGQPISRLSYISEMESQVGQQAFNTLATKTLIMQEARKKNIEVTDKEIDAEIKKIEDSLTKQGQKLDQVLELQGTTRKSLADQLKYQKILEKLVGQDVKVVDKEIDDYIAKNKDFYPEPEKADRNAVRDQIIQERSNEKISTYVNDLNKKAKIDSYLN